MSYDSKEDTLRHIHTVFGLIKHVTDDLNIRGLIHDCSKLNEPEKAIFDVYTPKLKEQTYGSEEYKQSLEEMKVALTHHYQMNRHHPEHFENGITGMNLIDLLEMVCDWYAATKRHENGDIYKSLEINQARFEYSDAVKNILKNTIDRIIELEQQNKPSKIPTICDTINNECPVKTIQRTISEVIKNKTGESDA